LPPPKISLVTYPGQKLIQFSLLVLKKVPSFFTTGSNKERSLASPNTAKKFCKVIGPRRDG
jgi:hypothetical protein